MTSIKDLRVAIVGGGVCGLTCAIALAKKGIRAHIYEAAVRIYNIEIPPVLLAENSLGRVR